MESFSERLGYTHKKLVLQHDEVDDAMLAGLWDVIDETFLTDIYAYRHNGYNLRFQKVCTTLWHSFFKQPIDLIPSNPQKSRDIIRKKYFSATFPYHYDLLEFLARIASHERGKTLSQKFEENCNDILEREKAIFRFVSGKLTPITDEIELREIESAVSNQSPDQVRTHIKSALEKYSDKANPDYRNSIKEAISAVEAAAKIVTGDSSATLGKALNSIEKTHGLDPALKLGLSKIYGWTSGENGIRHAMMENKEIREPDARFMLVSCSAFANYLLSLTAK